MNSESVPVIYLAGPYRGKTGWEVEANIHSAKHFGYLILRMGACAITPHTMFSGCNNGNLLPYLVLAVERSLVLKCDAIFMLPGWTDSLGSIQERYLAKQNNIPILYELSEVRSLVREYRTTTKTSLRTIIDNAMSRDCLIDPESIKDVPGWEDV